MQTTTEDDWIECVSCRNWLRQFCSPYKDKCVECGIKLRREKKSNDRKDLGNLVHCNLDSSRSFDSDIVHL